MSWNILYCYDRMVFVALEFQENAFSIGMDMCLSNKGVASNSETPINCFCNALYSFGKGFIVVKRFQDKNWKEKMRNNL